MSKDITNTEMLYDVIKRALRTEKAFNAAKKFGKYTFKVCKDATKIDIAKAVELVFPNRKVKSVNTVYMPSHAKRKGYKSGRTNSFKKAIVTIEGDPIDEIIDAY